MKSSFSSFIARSQQRVSRQLLKRLERTLLLCGLLLLVLFAGERIGRSVLIRAELERFGEIDSTQPIQSSGTLSLASGSPSNLKWWSRSAIAKYRRSLTKHIDPPMAVLRIPKVRLEAPIFEGTNALVLDRGLGHISATVVPGADGNIGIAGHRDSFFRTLKYIGVGDVIEVVMHRRTDAYVVDRTFRVNPQDLWVLEPRSVASITLVTCYPFYGIGKAAQRYIVQASFATSIANAPNGEPGDVELVNSN